MNTTCGLRRGLWVNEFLGGGSFDAVICFFLSLQIAAQGPGCSYCLLRRGQLETSLWVSQVRMMSAIKAAAETTFK